MAINGFANEISPASIYIFCGAKTNRIKRDASPRPINSQQIKIFSETFSNTFQYGSTTTPQAHPCRFYPVETPSQIRRRCGCARRCYSAAGEHCLFVANLMAMPRRRVHVAMLYGVQGVATIYSLWEFAPVFVRGPFVSRPGPVNSAHISRTLSCRRPSDAHLTAFDCRVLSDTMRRRFVLALFFQDSICDFERKIYCEISNRKRFYLVSYCFWERFRQIGRRNSKSARS